MLGTSLSLETAIGAMRIVSRMDYVSLVKTFGITEEDYKLVTGKSVWVPTRRERVRSVLHQLAFGVLDLAGVPRFDMPAEYCAAVIAIFVHPTNVLPACYVFENYRPGDEYTGSSREMTVITPSHLQVLVDKLYGSVDGSSIKDTFEKKVGRAIFMATQAGGKSGQAKEN